jgi:hypothetical protein
MNLADLEEAARLQPHNPAAHYHLGMALCIGGRFYEAVQSISAGLRLDPHNASAHNFLGIAWARLGQSERSIECFEQALRLNANYGEAYSNLAIAQVEKGTFAEAEKAFQHAMRCAPGNRLTVWNHSLLRLLLGDLSGGWPGYEQRWAEPGKVPRAFPQPRWRGEPLAGKTILVYAEQGFGDTLQFVRYLPLLQALGARVILECQAELTELLARVPGCNQVLAAGQPLSPFDFQIPLLSLPGVMGTTLANIPAGVPYLRAEPERVAAWRQAIPARPLRIGISWQGNPTFRGDRTRSIPLRHFEKLAQVPGVRLVSLQKGPGREQLPAFAARYPIDDLADRLTTFGETAAAMMNLDLIVSSCTALPHLAGALGRPVWTMLQFVPDWRWHLQRADSPWYPTMRLFRQRKPGDWDDVFERAAAALAVWTRVPEIRALGEPFASTPALLRS